MTFKPKPSLAVCPSPDTRLRVASLCNASSFSGLRKGPAWRLRSPCSGEGPGQEKGKIQEPFPFQGETVSPATLPGPRPGLGGLTGAFAQTPRMTLGRPCPVPPHPSLKGVRLSFLPSECVKHVGTESLLTGTSSKPLGEAQNTPPPQLPTGAFLHKRLYSLRDETCSWDPACPSRRDCLGEWIRF